MDRPRRDVFVISDLHLGDGGLRDKFEAGRKTSDLRAFLDHVGSEGGELFVLGDLFELWQMNWSLLFTRRREILDHLAALPLVYVPGNHDVDLAHFIGTGFLAHPFFRAMRLPFVRVLGGRRYRFFHGHETDPWNAGDDPGFGRMLAIFAAVFEDENGSPLLSCGEGVGDVLEQFGESMLAIWKTAAATLADRRPGAAGEGVRPNHALTPAQDPDRLVEHVAGVRADLEKGGYDVAVLGHTHRPGRIGDWYFNSGTWLGPESSFLRISPEGDVRLLEWKEGRAVERGMPVVLPDRAPPKKNPFGAALSAARALFPRPKKPERSRWVLIAQGALALALGCYALTVSIGRGAGAGWRVLVTAFGVYALLDGAMSLIAARREAPVKRLLSRVRGAASLLLGAVVLRRGYTAEIFVVLVGVYAFVAGALRVAASVVFRRMVDSRWLLPAGAGAMLAGLVLLLFPTSAALLKFVLSGALCYYGAGEILAGVFGQRLPRAAGALAARAASLALALLLASQAGCGVAQRAARSAAEGAIGAVTRKVGDRERVKGAAEGITRRAATGVVDELGQPEQLRSIHRIAAAMAAGTVAGVWSGATARPAALDRGGEQGRPGAGGASPVEAITEQAARAFSRQIVADLGPAGEGPLGASLSATTERLTESMARGARGDLSPLFPECRGADASICLDRAIERLGRAGAAGLAAGVRESLGVWPLVLAFGGGATASLALAWALAVYRARRPAPAP